MPSKRGKVFGSAHGELCDVNFFGLGSRQEYRTPSGRIVLGTRDCVQVDSVQGRSKSVAGVVHCQSELEGHTHGNVTA